MSKTILVIAAHSDDECLGAAGTLALHARAGDSVHLLFLTNGVGAREPDRSSVAAAKGRIEATNKAARIIGAQTVRMLDFPDNQLDSIPLLQIVQAIENEILSITPSIIYTHHMADLNIDHRICHQAVLTAFRPLPRSKLRALYGFEVASSTEWAFNGIAGQFNPQRFVDITDTLSVKMSALQAYEEEMRPFPHARSYKALDALARWRGANVGCCAAEAFTVIREVIANSDKI